MRASIERNVYCAICRAPVPAHADDCPRRVIVLETEREEAELEAAIAAAARNIVHPRPGTFIHENGDSVFF
jgi:hypothetical protein